MKRRSKRGISLGTFVMLLMTCLVLGSYFVLIPRLTDNADFSLNASELAVALDRSIVQFSNAASSARTVVRETILPPIVQTTPSPTAAPTAVPKLSFTLCAAGSLKFNSAVQAAVTQNEQYHFEQIFEPIAQSLNADLTIATLENSVISSQKLSDGNMPSQLLSGLKTSGFDALSLGYYNALNNGTQGLQATKSEISQAGLTSYGAYASLGECNAPILFQAGGVSVALLSYQSELSATGKKKTTTEEQAFVVANLQLPVIKADIETAKGMGAQVILVSLCWGKTGANEPSATQEELAQAIADAGADIILGTRSESVQKVEILTANRNDDRYHPVLCAYNLGNLFTFNREKRVSLAGILLHATVVYDPGAETVAFDGLSYTPTYCWRGKEEGVNRYRVLNSAEEQFPSYVNADQQNVMNRCLETIQKVMKGSLFSQQ